MDYWKWPFLQCVTQGCPNSVLEDRCPAAFSSHLPQHTCMEASSMPSKTSISCFRCVWLGLELNSAGHRPSRTEFGQPWCNSSKWMKTSCKVFNLKVHRVLKCTVSTLNYWNESFSKRILRRFMLTSTWNISIPPPFGVGLNENANSFFATRWRFWVK